MDDQKAIGDDEFIYRRIPVSKSWCDNDQNNVKPDAFNPRKGDAGLSVTRLKSEKHPEFLSIEEAAKGKSPQGYFMARLNVGELRRNNIDVISKPMAENPGHAEISNLTYENRKREQSQSLMVLLAHNLVESVEGPFGI